MVERKVWGSNLMSFLDATTSGMIDPLSRMPNAQKATSYDEGRINAQEGREQLQVCGQICYSARQKIMTSPLVSKVNKPPHLADFAAHRDCSGVEAAPAARRLPPAGALGTLRLPRGNKGTIGHEQHTSRRPRLGPF